MNRSAPLETALRHDRIIVLAELAGMGAVAWGYMLHEARGNQGLRTFAAAAVGRAATGGDSDDAEGAKPFLQVFGCHGRSVASGSPQGLRQSTHKQPVRRGLVILRRRAVLSG